MLKTAQLYENELQKEYLKSWYKQENIYLHGGPGEHLITLPNNNGERHCFVSVNKHDEVIGYITYCVDWSAMSAYGWEIISFRKGSIAFAKDLYRAICDCFEVYHMNRISWYCYADNPAIRGYRNFIKRHGGCECGHSRQVSKLKDGKLHDDVCFEILASEFRKDLKG